jgi:uncharacterized protein (TIGR00304 family)
MYETLFSIGFILILIGFAIAFLAMILMIFKGKASIKGGGAILIGPIPIVFGTDREILKVAIIVLIILIIIVFVLMSFYVFIK